MLPLFFLLGIHQKIFMIVAGILTVWYSLGFFKIKNNFISLRSIPFLKLFWIAFIWTAVSVFFPLLEDDFTATYGFLLAERIFFILAITIPFDVRDIESDNAEGLRTLPVYFGSKSALNISLGFIMAFVFLVLLATCYHIHDVWSAIALIISGIISAVMIGNTRTTNSPLYFTLGMEGLSLVQTLLLAISMLI
jgi:4-hydroxybenzoate polyprenyltransferase